MTGISRKEVEALIVRLRRNATWNNLNDEAITALTSLLARLSEVEKALELLSREVFGEVGSEPNVYADYDRLTELHRIARSALTPKGE